MVSSAMMRKTTARLICTVTLSAVLHLGGARCPRACAVCVCGVRCVRGVCAVCVGHAACMLMHMQ